MTNKNIIIVGVGMAAFFLLGGSDILGGGASGGGSRKATAITGFVGDDPSKPPALTPEQPIADVPLSKKEEIITNPTVPFKPSEYLLGLMGQKYATNPPAVTAREAAYERGTQKMFQGFNYPEMVKVSGGYGYDQQQVYVSKKDVGVAGAGSKVVVAPQSYVDRVFDASQKTNTGFSLDGIAAPQDYVDRVSSAPVSKKSSTPSNYNKGAGNVGNSSSGYRYSGSTGGWGV